uniref:Aquaporin-10 n=1 Tax=Milnesium tardigradum TaxID=46460 RepID=AQP10_MILTA|nr:RecName: Full=Aquaporin-10; Short=AQP-10 [Milnesium tardigradum]AEP14564.1 aquaporin 10 [Milnesium tardigradum]
MADAPTYIRQSTTGTATTAPTTMPVHPDTTYYKTTTTTVSDAPRAIADVNDDNHDNYDETTGLRSGEKKTRPLVTSTTAPIDAGRMTLGQKISRWTRIGSDLAREALAEFLGSFILIVFGNGVVAQVVLSRGAHGNFLSINIGYGLAVAFGVYIAGGISGGHLNPAVSLAFAALGKLPWRKLPVYMFAQYAGCICASAIVHAIYYDALNNYDGGNRTRGDTWQSTAGIHASYPQEFLYWQTGLADQIFATSFLMIGILALTDNRNTGPPGGVVPILVGCLVMAIGLAYGFNCGYPINPARDMGPRLFTLMAGWGSRTFSNYNPYIFNDYYQRIPYWFWIPVVGPHLGALLGAAIYFFFIGNHWPTLHRNVLELQVGHRDNSDDIELLAAKSRRPIEVVTTTETTRERRT